MPAKKTAMPDRYAALLRGINVGGKNLLPMKDLIQLFVAAGCDEVSTYIQSGNVLFSAPAKVTRTLPAVIGEAISKRFGFSIPVILRSAEELGHVASKNPFLAKDADPAALHVSFLADAPEAARARKLDPKRSPPDELIVKGKEVYLHLPNGMGRTRLTNAYLDSTLGTVSTARNWRTVLKLVELAQG
jgi:uncharacterized protein (DUF1697 family)